MKKSLNIIAAAFVGAIIGAFVTDTIATNNQKQDSMLPNLEWEQRYNFGTTSAILLEDTNSVFDEITLIQQITLSKLKPEHIKSLCFETQPYGEDYPGEYELALKLTFTSEYRETLHHALQRAEGTHLKLEYRNRNVFKGVLDANGADHYAQFIQEYPQAYDIGLSAWNYNHAGLIEFAKAISPEQKPQGCGTAFKITHINKEGRLIASKLWKS